MEFVVQHFDKPSVSAAAWREIGSFFVPAERIQRCRHLGGIPNVVFALEADEDSLAIRVLNNGYTTEEHLDLEIATLRHLEAEGFPWSPRLVPSLDGGFVSSWRGYRVIAMRLVAGDVAVDEDVAGPFGEELGGAIAALTRALRRLDYDVPDTESYWRRSERLLDLLPARMPLEPWGTDVVSLRSQWRAAADVLRAAYPVSELVHTDIWQENVLVQAGRLTGLVDFDDLATGPVFLDVAAALSEFAIGPSFRVLDGAFRSIVAGFRREGGVLGDDELSLLLPAFTVCYASWLANNVLHGVPLGESAMYVERLVALRDPSVQDELLGQVRSAIGE
jgi:Ser/Thr protein kinase RdoA (MazF antagonist)